MKSLARVLLVICVAAWSAEPAATALDPDPFGNLLRAPAREWLQARETTQSGLVEMVAEGALSQLDPDRRILPEERSAIVEDVTQCTSLTISRDSDWGERTVGDYMAACFTAAGIPVSSSATR